MKNYSFKLPTDEALLYVNFLGDDVKSECELLKNFFIELKSFRRNNVDISPKHNEDINYEFIRVFSCLDHRYTAYGYEISKLYEKYGSLSAINCEEDKKKLSIYIREICKENEFYPLKKHAHFADFIRKYDEVLSHILNNNIAIHYCDLRLIRKLFDTGEYSDSHIDNIISFIEYLKSNYNKKDRIKSVLERISEADIPNVEMGNEEVFKRDGIGTIDFHHKERYGGFFTTVTFTNGKIKRFEGDNNFYQYHYQKADFLLDLRIKPAFPMLFDLSNDDCDYYTFYNEHITVGDYKETRLAKQHNSTIYAKDWKNGFTIHVDNLTFKPESLPSALTLDSTLFKLLPDIKIKTEINKKAYEVNETIKKLDDLVKKAEADGKKPAEVLNSKQRETIKEAYIEMYWKINELRGLKAQQGKIKNKRLRKLYHTNLRCVSKRFENE